jgi:hypothetical protein
LEVEALGIGLAGMVEAAVTEADQEKMLVVEVEREAGVTAEVERRLAGGLDTDAEGESMWTRHFQDSRLRWLRW